MRALWVSILCAGCIETSQPVFMDRIVPKDQPQLFLPGEVSIRGEVHFGSAFSDDGSTIVYTTTAKGEPGNIVVQEYQNGSFGERVAVEQDDKYSYSDATISPDGKIITLTSNRPDDLNDTLSSPSRFWQYERTNAGWKPSRVLNLNLPTGRSLGYPTFTKSGVMYFHYFLDGEQLPDLYRAEPRNGGFEKPVKLPSSVNTDQFEGDVFVSQDESFIIFAGFERPVNYGLSDLYIAFKTEKGWSKAVNLGSEINSHGYDGSPYVTPDHSTLIFTSSRHPEVPSEQEYFNLFYVKLEVEKYRESAVLD